MQEIRSRTEAELFIKIVETICDITHNSDIKIPGVDEVIERPVDELFLSLIEVLNRVQYRQSS